MDRPRILVSSIPVWNNESGSDTFSNLLSGYDPNKVANIYFKSGIPCSPVCLRYFHISENSVIKSIIKRTAITGREVDAMVVPDEMNAEQEIERKRYSFFSKYRLWLFLLGRELLWKIGKWTSKEVDEFIEDFKPEVLFYPIEGYLYFNRFTEYLIKKTKATTVGIIWDDNFTYKLHPYSLGFRIHRFLLRKQVKRIINASNKLYVINEKMQKELHAEFGYNSDILTKGAEIHAQIEKPSDQGKELTIVYTGKLNLGRLDTVAMLAEVLETQNEKNDLQFRLDIYSGTVLGESEKRKLERKGTHFMGSVPQSEIPRIHKGADILLMAEAINGKHKYDARLSFSTKIVDYLAAGKCILAIGPLDIAPIEYLKKEDAAIVASGRDDLSKLFGGYITNKLIYEYSRKALDTALKNHDIRTIQARLYTSFCELQKHQG